MVSYKTFLALDKEDTMDHGEVASPLKVNIQATDTVLLIVQDPLYLIS